MHTRRHYKALQRPTQKEESYTHMETNHEKPGDLAPTREIKKSYGESHAYPDNQQQKDNEYN